MALELQGVRVPTFLYGTAWKEERTQALVTQALQLGFTGIDTANQRKHYHEAAVGEALRRAFASGLKREQLFVQTKFTSVGGQDHRLPYDPNAPPAMQVRQSFLSSLEHLHVETLDAYVLHGPSLRTGLSATDLAVWREMEALHAERRVRLLGISNVSLEQLALLCERATVAPALVQNRCYARTGWDREVRAFCTERGIGYQGFSLLTANRAELASPAVRQIATRYRRTPEQLVFRFAHQVGMICLTGSGDPAHLAADLACDDFELARADLAVMEQIAGAATQV